MKKALVFVAAFALVLVAGVAVAFMTSPSGDGAGEPASVEEPTTTTSVKETESPPTTEKAPETKEVKKDPPKEQGKKVPSKEKADDTSVDKPVEEVDTTPPDLVVLFPENGQHFETQKIAFEGKTEPGARVFAGDYEAEVDAEGNWRIVLILTNRGGNLATFKAIDEAGNKATASVKAYYDAPAEDEPKDEKPKDDPKGYEFWAKQKYGSCSEDPAYDKWYGKGEPGTKIWIESKYGSGQTVIDKHGEWYLKVHFPDAPCGDAFQVVLETDDGHRKTYEFVRLCDEPKDEGHKDK